MVSAVTCQNLLEIQSINIGHKILETKNAVVVSHEENFSSHIKFYWGLGHSIAFRLTRLWMMLMA